MPSAITKQHSQITPSNSSKFCMLLISKQWCEWRKKMPKNAIHLSLQIFEEKSYTITLQSSWSREKNPGDFDKSKHPIWRWAIITYFMQYSARLPLTSTLFTHSTKQSGKRRSEKMAVPQHLKRKSDPKHGDTDLTCAKCAASEMFVQYLRILKLN